MKKKYRYIVEALLILILLAVTGYISYSKGYTKGNYIGYSDGYDKGYSVGIDNAVEFLESAFDSTGW